MILKHRKLKSDYLFNSIIIDNNIDDSMKDVMNSTKVSNHKNENPLNLPMTKIFQRYFKKWLYL